MQLLMTVDVEQRAELETLIRDLEDENRLVWHKFSLVLVRGKNQTYVILCAAVSVV